MLHFNELYITEDGKNLVIDAEVDNLDIYNDCFISQVTVQIIGYNKAEDKCIYSKTVEAQSCTHFVGDIRNDGMLDEKDIEIW